MRAELLLSQEERHDWRLSVDLVCRLELMQVSWRQDVPARTVGFEVLALALKHACTDLGSGRVVSARVGNVLDATKRHIGRNEMRVVGNERRPLLVFGHGDGAAAQTLNCLVSIITLALEDASKCVVSLLDLANNNRLELATGGFEVEVGLITLVNVHVLSQYSMATHSVKVVLLINLLLDCTVDAKPDDVWVVLASCAAILVVGMLQRFLELLDFPPCSLLFLINGVLEVAAQALDFLDLLAEITAESTQTADDVVFDLARLVGFSERVSVEVLENASRIGKTVVGQHHSRVRNSADRALNLGNSFGA